MGKYTILLDENIPSSLKILFPDVHEVKSVADMNWQGKKNGELLKLMLAKNFNVFITNDKNLSYQNQIKKLNLIVFVLDSMDNRKETLKLHLLQIVKQLRRKKLTQRVIWIQI